MKISFNNNLLILSSLIFFIKPLEYLAANLFIANFAEDLIYPLFFHLIIYIFFILSFFICLKLKNVTLNKFFVALAASYYLQYYFLDINEFTQLILPRISNNFITYLISITFILIVSIFFSIKFFSSNNKRFFLVFTLLLCISQIGVMSINFINSFAFKDQGSNKEIYSSEIKLQKIKEVKGENIYYIVLDGMTSYKYIVEESKIENNLYNQFNQNLKKKKFKVLDNSFSSYNTTYLTLASIFNLDYFDENYVYKNRNNFFPQMLYKKNPPKLIQNLAYLDYEFNYHGNMWAGCKKSLHFSCSQDQSINPTANNFIYKLSTYFNNSGIVVFTQKSFIGLVIRKFILIHNPMSKQDGLDNFLYNEIYSIKPYSKKFYFIHNLSPHPPYPNKNCEFDSTGDATRWMNINFYNQSVSCTVTKIENVLNNILSIDPSAIIILQGDHGPNFNYDFNLHPNSMDRITLRERFSIHNSIRLPERCDFDANTIIGNVETINIVINCISNEEVKNFNNKSYAGFYENNKEMFGKLIEVTEYLK